MTQEDKNLLLKDICARLPYEVCVHIRYNTGEPCYGKLMPMDIQWFIDSKVEIIKPYLRPMSSMTDEEREEWADLFNLELDKLNEIDDENKAEELAPYYFGKSHQVSIDWLNAHHFDYRGLIEKGLALEATKGMYKNE